MATKTLQYDLAISSLTASRILETDANKKLVSSATTSAELGYLAGITPGTAAANKALVLDGSLDIAGINDMSLAGLTSTDLTASRALVSDGAKKLTSSVTTLTELSYVNGATSNLQAQIDAIVVSDTVYSAAWNGVTTESASKNALYDKINLIDNRDIAKVMTGFVSWDSGGPYWSFSAGLITILVAGSGYIKDILVTWAGSQQTIGAFASHTTNWIYIDNTGTIGHTATRTEALFEDNIVLLEVYYNGSTAITVKETHPYNFGVHASNWAHDTVGVVLEGIGAVITRVAVGTGAAAGDREIKIVGADVLHDHGLETVVPDSAGVGVTQNIMYTDGSGNWNLNVAQTQITNLWNSAGTPTAISNGKYVNYRLYVGKDNLNSSTPIYFAVMGNVEHGNAASANADIADNTVPLATSPLIDLEMAQLGFATMLGNASGGYIFQLVVSRQVLTSQVAAGQANTAALVTTDTSNFNNILSVSDATVQAALDTLDDGAVKVPVGLTHGDVLFANSTPYITRLGVGAAGTYLKSQGAGVDLIWGTPAGAGDMLASVYDAAAITEQLVGLTAAQTLTTKTLTSPIINTQISGTAFLDEDNMASNSATKVTSQQSQKAYMDNLKGDYTTLDVDGAAFTPTTTNGATSGTNEYGTNDIDWDYSAFDSGATEERIQFKVNMPDDWDLGTIKVKLYWSSATGSTAGDTVEWGVKAGGLADDDAIDAALGTPQVISDTLLANNGTDLQIATTPAITVGGTPALGDITTFEIYRNTDGTDDMTEDAWLFKAVIQYKKLTTATAIW